MIKNSKKVYNAPVMRECNVRIESGYAVSVVVDGIDNGESENWGTI
ncbi:MAG: hypothetical protein IKC42_00825 [Alistipes sp.]|nr:hypothetical protein [Alistipes sp.]